MTTTVEIEVRAVRFGGDETWHLFRHHTEGTLCGLPIPNRRNVAYAGQGDCPACVPLHVVQSLNGHQAEPPADLTYPVCEQAESGQTLPTIVEYERPEQLPAPLPAQDAGNVIGHFRASLDRYQVKETKDGLVLEILLSQEGSEAMEIAANLARLAGQAVSVTITGYARQLAFWS